MTAENKDSILALLGVALIVYAIGTTWVTWVRPKSVYEPIFRARWRFGIPASRLGAVALVAVHITLGSFFLLGAFHSKLAAVPGYATLVVCAFSIFARLVDLWKADSEA
ncbi:hypothetical protein [Lysobacter sp. P5_B9]